MCLPSTLGFATAKIIVMLVGLAGGWVDVDYHLKYITMFSITLQNVQYAMLGILP